MDSESEPHGRARIAMIEEAYVLKPISTTRRFITAVFILLPAVLLAGYGWVEQAHAGTLVRKGWIYFAILAVAAVWAFKVWRRKDERVLATLSRPIRAINPAKRLVKASALLAAAMLGCAWYLQPDAAKFSQYWVYAWPAPAIYAAYVIFLLVPQYSHEFTPAAKEEYARLQQAKQAEVGKATWIDDFTEKVWPYWWVRYGLGAGLFWAAWEFAQLGDRAGWICAIAFLILALACMKEIFAPLAIAVGIGGILLTLYGVIAALPVSAAIIIGAAIIAQAMRK